MDRVSVIRNFVFDCFIHPVIMFGRSVPIATVKYWALTNSCINVVASVRDMGLTL